MSARKRKRFGKRALIAGGLVAFVVFTSIVVYRRSVGVAKARAIAQLETRIRDLRSDKLTLERDISDASSNQRVVTEAAKRLGMHVATQREVRSVARDPRAVSAQTSDSASR